MRLSAKFVAVLVTVAFLAGCAGPNSRTANKNLLCAVAGGVVGGAATAAVDGGSGVAGGAAVGAMLALLLCPNDEVAAEPVVAAQPVCNVVPPAGALVDASGCPFDDDKDGVYEGIDMCRNTPEGVSVDRVGCPIDSDDDAVADYMDLCPDTPEGVIVDQDGCPLPGQNVLSLTGVNFGFNKATLTAEAKEILEQAVTVLKDVDGIVEVRVEGHTDSIGSESYNLKLSQKRAQSVVDYLVSRGIDGSNLIAVGMGEGYPVANNDSEAGRSANRRVDFVVNQ